jgi:FKBP-type peptidyl-prolyl cis-trans isomerase 2
MKNKTLAIILLVIIIVGTLSLFLIATYDGDILNQLFGKKTEEKVIALGDCASVEYIARYALNNTIFKSSYADSINKTGGVPFKIFIGWNTSQYRIIGSDNFTSDIKGLIKGLIGLKEGDSKTIGPISPEEAFGISPKVGDVIILPIPTISNRNETKLQITNISNNEATTLFVLRDISYSPGEKTIIYPSWENATVITKMNETKIWTYTTPPENKRENFTWIVQTSQAQMTYWKNASSVTSINDSTIVITHNPKIGAQMSITSSYGSYIYTVVNIAKNITVSYVNQNTGNITYYHLSKTVLIPRNESRNITITYTKQQMGQFLDYIKNHYNPDLILSVNNLANKSLIYEVHIIKIYKNS